MYLYVLKIALQSALLQMLCTKMCDRVRYLLMFYNLYQKYVVIRFVRYNIYI